MIGHERGREDERFGAVGTWANDLNTKARWTALLAYYTLQDRHLR